jgi:predicted nuclease of predicted toxin-antitoxin system
MIFLIDANLPYHFSLWKSSEFCHVFDLNELWSDTEIWNYARAHNLTIVTKDADFSNRILFTSPPPKVIHLRIGNLKMRELFDVLNKQWPEIMEFSKSHKLVNFYLNRIEGIN